MTLVPTPGYGQPMLEPGANLAAWIDNILLPGKFWNDTWDPEGLFSTLPAIVSGITGMLAAKILIGKESIERRILYLMSAGFIATIAGYAWGWVFPMNKPIWTSSYVLFTSGVAAMVLGVSMFFIDVLGKTKGLTPWLAFGSNAITVYVLGDLLSLIFYRAPLFGASLNSHAFNLLTSIGFAPKLASLTYAVFYLVIILIPAIILYRRKVFIKL